MTTAEKIEAMTDAGEFEILATRVLRELDPDCRDVIHAGVNAQGKTIANPIDAFCLVPGSNPPRYVMAAFTLTAPEDLIRKWLFDHTKSKPSGKPRKAPLTASDDGDLTKSAREAAVIKARRADAKFVVWLCTNRRLDSGTQQQVHERAAEFGVDVRFLEQSQIRDFLDVKPEGQWLRQVHLGIEADRISRSLLCDLSQQSLSRYSSELLLPPLDEIIRTEAAESAATRFRERATLHLLSGPSGAGKSVVSHELLQRHISAGGIGLWFPAEVVERASSLPDAIKTVVQSLHPRAGVESGHEALRIATPGFPLVLVIDDANRSPNPVGLVRKVIGWSRPQKLTGNVADMDEISFRIICPIWDAVWYPLRHTFDSMNWIRVQQVGPMTRAEAIACLRAALGQKGECYTDAQLGDFADRLHDDPILLGLFGRLLKARNADNVLAVADNVISRVTEQAVGELADSKNATPLDYLAALRRLSLEMIRRRNLYPRWEDAQSWFQADATTVSRLAELATQGHICRFSQAADVRRLEFRHDRVLEYHLSLSAAEMLLSGSNDRDAVADPFFTQLVGRAIARNRLPVHVLEWTRHRNPVALIAAVPYLTESEPDYADEVALRARAWLEHAREFPDPMRYAALWTLAGASSPRVLAVTEGVPGSQRVWEARLRNGDVEAGTLALSGEFYPAMRFPWLESLIEEARMRFSTQLTDKLRLLLRSKELDDKQRQGALCLAGYLGDVGLAGDVNVAWEAASEWRNVLLAALWAACRCSGDSPEPLLDRMMPCILQLQHDESGQSFDERNSLLRQLRFASRHGFGEPVVAYLATLGNSHDEFRWVVAAILDEIDHPIAIQYLVPLYAEATEKAKQAGGFFPWAMSWHDRLRRDEGCLSGPSMATLKAVWTAEENPEWLQKFAFAVWSRNVTDTTELACIQLESPHYENAAWQLALRGDRRAAQCVLAKLKTGSQWFHVVPHVWDSEFEPFVDAALSQLASHPNVKAQSWSNEHYEMADLVHDLPTEVAERLLAKHWSGLKNSSLFLQAALYHGTAKCRELAASSLVHMSDADEPFKHLDMYFGFQTKGRADRLTPRHLETLVPYIQRLNDQCLGNMLQWCRRFEYWPWAKVHLEPEMRRRVPSRTRGFDGSAPYLVRMVQRWFATDEELLAELREMESIDPRFRRGHLSRWWDNFDERGDPEGRASRLLFAWLANDCSSSRFTAAAELVSDRGKRRDLHLLTDTRPGGDDDSTHQALASAEFAVKLRSLD